MKKITKDKIKTWFVTGASSGVGYEICKQLLERGYQVIAVSRRIPDFNHENALCLSVDVTEPETIKEAINKGIKKFGKIDVLSNNAGISAEITLEEETIENMNNIMKTNFFGSFNTIQAILPHFRKNKNGTIINNTSMHGLSVRSGGSAYCSSKHALEGLTDVLRHETQRFCRVMTFELGIFGQTDVVSKAKIKKTEIDEYKNLPSYPKRIYETFYNDLEKAVSIIIDEIEKEKLPKRLMLGKDACFKIKKEIQFLKKDLKYSKKYSNKCSKYKLSLILNLIKRFLKKYMLK